jgi:hypothetical protein
MNILDGTYDGPGEGWALVTLVAVAIALVGGLVYAGIAIAWWAPLAFLALTPIGWMAVGWLGWRAFLAVERKIRG